MTTSPVRPVRAALAAVALAGLLLTGCSGDDQDGPGAVAPPPGEIEDLGGPGVPQEWLDHWCDTRDLADADAAVELLGEPTSTVPEGSDGGEQLLWEHDSGVVLTLVTGPDGALVDRSSSVPSDQTDEVREALACG
ncbi:hypothetical protein [Nocardioides perillae]|uniref:Uncharacterized protein n=1 Tax=Nocardioides perillae TaxID=1119534 RepID=A0A7Y9UR04_9ACTN|nr:hypothetical protein [Nocardioides perillae]NYG53849.1 hypothetical protein [Nocardioides perillae]